MLRGRVCPRATRGSTTRHHSREAGDRRRAWPLGGVVRPRRVVRFARLIHRSGRVLGGPAVRAAYSGSLSLLRLPRIVVPHLQPMGQSACGREELRYRDATLAEGVLMGIESHTSGGERERYERIAATAIEVIQEVIGLAQGGPTPLDLVVRNITTLTDDAVALSASTPSSPGLRSAPLATERGATALPQPRPSTSIRQIATLDDQIAIERGGFAEAISDAKQACKELAAVSGHPDPSLLHAITAALTCVNVRCQMLGQLVDERTDAVSSLSGVTRRPIDDSRVIVKATDELVCWTG